MLEGNLAAGFLDNSEELFGQHVFQGVFHDRNVNFLSASVNSVGLLKGFKIGGTILLNLLRNRRASRK